MEFENLKKRLKEYGTELTPAVIEWLEVLKKQKLMVKLSSIIMVCRYDNWRILNKK